MNHVTKYLLRLVLIALSIGTAAFGQPADPPNIILILTDDQGWTSMSSAMDDRYPDAKSDYHRTPHMDALAARGLRFSQGYAAAPVCSPTRYSIQFGKTPARLGKTLVRGPNRVDHTQLSLPQLLKRIDGRYVCAHFGKWHIAAEPEELGYDISDGQTTNREGGFTNGKPAEWNGYTAEDPKRIDHVTDRGIEFVRRQTEAGRPFFLQLSHYAVHSDIVYRDDSLIAVDKWLPGRVHQNAGYAAMMKDLDDGIGRFMRAYDELGLEVNTYVFFLSDNGGMPVIPPRRRDGAAYKTGLNAPLRRGKWDLTEGGIRVPFFVTGPRVPAATQCDAPIVTYDLMPTFAALAGSAELLPADLDGTSFVSLLRDPSAEAPQRPPGGTIVFHMPHYNFVGLAEPHSAIRRGRYKLLKFWISGRSLLFDLHVDPGERHDLSREMPDHVASLERALAEYLESIDAETPAESVTWQKGGGGKITSRFLEGFPAILPAGNDEEQ